MTMIELAPATLLRDVEDDSVASFYALVCDSQDGGLIPFEEAAAEIMQQVADKWLVPEPNGVPDVRTCDRCGCTDEFACLTGCSWPTDDATTCSACIAEAAQR